MRCNVIVSGLMVAWVVNGCDARLGEASTPGVPVTSQDVATSRDTSNAERTSSQSSNASSGASDRPASMPLVFDRDGTPVETTIDTTPEISQLRPSGQSANDIPADFEPGTCAQATETFEGVLFIDTVEDLAALRLVREVKGNVFLVLEEEITEVTLPCLESISGGLFMPLNSGDFNNDVERLSLPRLRTVSGEFFLGASDSVQHLALHALSEVGSTVTLEGLTQMSDLALSSLTTVGGDLVVHDNDELPSLPLESLSNVDGDVIITDNIAMPQCALVHMFAQLQDHDMIGGAVNIAGNDEACECNASGSVISDTCN